MPDTSEELRCVTCRRDHPLNGEWLTRVDENERVIHRFCSFKCASTYVTATGMQDVAQRISQGQKPTGGSGFVSLLAGAALMAGSVLLNEGEKAADEQPDDDDDEDDED